MPFLAVPSSFSYIDVSVSKNDGKKVIVGDLIQGVSRLFTFRYL